MNKSKWQKVGQVCVDTASLLLIDPCHVYDAPIEESVQKLISGDSMHVQIMDDCETPHNCAVLMQTGMGDGYYDVDVKKDEDGLIYEMRIKFCAK